MGFIDTMNSDLSSQFSRLGGKKPRTIIEVQSGKLCCEMQMLLLIYSWPWLLSLKVTKVD